MSDALVIDVDDAAVLAAIDEVPDAVHRYLKAAAKVTADRIEAEAHGRIRRRTGRTGEAITVEETHSGDGYVIYVGQGRQHIGSYLEFGTRFMRPYPFLFASARLEEGAHDRRAREAVQAAIDEKGLGE